MRTTFIAILTAFLATGLLQAQSLQETIDAQALEIKQLKRALNIKEQELKILLITIKNSKQESMLHSAEQHLKFQDIDKISATRVVIKPSMLSETAIKEINQGGDTDTDVIEDNLNKASTETAENEMKENTDATAEEKDVNTEVVVKSAEKKEIPKLTYMKPSTYFLTMDTKVYKELFANEGETWSKGMRFTSNKKRGSWIQITGKIINARWKAVESTLWIDENCVKKVR